MLRNSGSKIIITRRKKEMFNQLPPCLIREDISDNIGPIIYLFMLQMPCQIILKRFLGRQLHINLHLHIIMHFSLILKVGVLIKRRVKAI